jgi:hypothetical protein
LQNGNPISKNFGSNLKEERETAQKAGSKRAKFK